MMSHTFITIKPEKWYDNSTNFNEYFVVFY